MPDSVIWGIHAGKLGDADSLFNGGWIALGWEEVGDLSKLPATRAAFKDVMRAAYPDRSPGAIPVNAGQLFRFMHEAKDGDLIVWRPKHEPTRIRIGKIVGSYKHDPADQRGYPHQRPVTWNAEVDATQLTQGALFELGSAMSFFSIRKHAAEWIDLLQGNTGTSVPPDEESDTTIGPVAEQIEENTRDFILKKLSTELKGHPLASFVAHVLNVMGYHTRVSPPGADGGVDIIAHRDVLGFEPPIIKAQVKSGAGKVGQPEVSSLLGTLSVGEQGLVVALGGFTPQATALARNKSNLRLVDGDDLVELVLAHYEGFDSRYKGVLPLRRVYVPDPNVDGL